MSSSRTSSQILCVACPLHSRAAFRKRSAVELDLVQRLKTGELWAEPGSTLLAEGNHSAHLCTVQEGWAFRYKSLDDGRRQILSFALPGDLLSIQGVVSSELRYTVEALTSVRLCLFPRKRLSEESFSKSALGRDLLEISALAEKNSDLHLQSLGRRTAAERLAYLILHLANRCRALELAQGSQIQFPLTQAHIADALGVSLVHTNKTLRSLTRRRLIKWSIGFVEICDETALRQLSKYDDCDGAKRPFI